MADAKMDSDRKVRALREKIIYLTGAFDERFGDVFKSIKTRNLRDLDFSIYEISAAGEKFYQRIAAYDINIDNADELRTMTRSLKILKRNLEMQLEEMRDIRKSELKEISMEIQETLRNSTIMQKLSTEELNSRINSLEFDESMTLGEYKKRLIEEIDRIDFDRDSARGMIVVNSNSELRKLYDGLLEMDYTLEKEEKHREKHRDVSRKYNKLCVAYQSLETLEKEISELKISDERRKRLEDKKVQIILDLNNYFETEKNLKLFDDVGVLLQDKEIMQLLKGEIQDLAFEKNSLIGIVDEVVVKKDKLDLKRLQALDKIETCTNLNSLQKEMKNNPSLQKNPNAEELAKRIELKLKLQWLMEIYQKERKLISLKKRLEELNNKPEEKLTEAERKEKQKLSAEITSINKEINKISNVVSNIRELGKELNIPCLLDDSFDLNSVDNINNIAINQVDFSIKQQKDRINSQKKKILDRYSIVEELPYEQLENQIDKRVNEIEKEKRFRIIDKDEHRGAVLASEYGSILGPKEHSELTTRSTGVLEEEFNYDESGDTKIIRRMKVYDTEAQLETIDDRFKQRIECGIVYRYERGDDADELLFVEEPLEIYLDNPKKKLKEVLDNLRSRMLKEVDSENDLINYCDEAVENQEFKGLLSNNPIKRLKARRDFIKKLEKANRGNEGMAYVNMAIALNSEVSLKAVEETMDRLAQPYQKENDIKKYVKMKDEKTLLGLTHKETGRIYHSRLNETQKRNDDARQKFNSELNLHSEANGMVRPFEITIEDIRENTVGEIKKKPKNRKKTQAKNNNKSQENGEIE